MAQRFNRDGHAIVDHRTWFSWGRVPMEGISHERLRWMGLGINKLVAFGTKKHPHDGNTDGCVTATPEKFRGLWLERGRGVEE